LKNYNVDTTETMILTHIELSNQGAQAASDTHRRAEATQDIGNEITTLLHQIFTAEINK